MRPLDTIDAALADLKLGRMIIVVDDENRENEGDFVMLADFVTPEAVNFMATQGRGLICAPVDVATAQRLALGPQAPANTTSHGTAFTVSVDAFDNVSTGISAADRAHTLKLMADPTSPATAFARPGHIFPLVAREGGVLVRPGHTEATVDLARLVGAAPVGVICEIMNVDGSMARRPDLELIADAHELKIISIEDLIRYRKAHENLLDQVESVPLKTTFGDFNLTVFRSNTLGQEHMAITKGNAADWAQGAPLLRIHSECFTGDVLGSARCDCGEQLHQALRKIEKAGSGIIIYMRQEGRGIGLMNKVRAYQLQDKGLDTVEANLCLGLPADAREYSMAAQLLRHFGVKRARLMTNNPLKLQALKDLGLEEIQREPLEIQATADNKFYLRTKEAKLGHWFDPSIFNNQENSHG